MKIQFQSLYRPIYKGQKTQNTPTNNYISTHSSTGDCFVNNRGKNLFTYEQYLQKRDKLQICDYKNLCEADKQQIRSTLLETTKTAAHISSILAKALKSKLDEKYGENCYVFVSIGTSPSLIAKAMECMGIETKYLPISGLGNEYFDIDDAIENKKYFEKYGKFLKSQSVTKKDLSKSDKKFIFYDYTASGRTLRSFERIMKERFELPEDKIEFRSIDKDLKNFFNNTEYKDYAQEYIANWIEPQYVQLYSSSDHLNVFSVPFIAFSPERLSRHQNPSVKSFNFCIMDELDTEGLLKENPKNETAL